MENKTFYDSRPVKSSDEMNELLEALAMSKRYGRRNVLLWKFGVSTGLRVSDIVGIKIADVFGKSSFTIVETKTSKKRTVFIHSLMADIADYLATLPEGTVYLFPSRKGDSHITTTQAYRIITTAAADAGLSGITTHSMRRTFGYYHYRQFNDIGELMAILNHSSAAETLKYIGITDETIGESLRTLRIFE